MEYNKNEYRKTDDKRVLHKVRKHWVVVSLALLMAIGGQAAVSHVSAHADTNNNQINNANTIKEQMNQKLIQAQNRSNQNQTSNQGVNVAQSNQDKGQTAPSSNINIQNNNQNSQVNVQQITKRAQALHQQILGNADMTQYKHQYQNNNNLVNKQSKFNEPKYKQLLGDINPNNENTWHGHISDVSGNYTQLSDNVPPTWYDGVVNVFSSPHGVPGSLPIGAIHMHDGAQNSHDGDYFTYDKRYTSDGGSQWLHMTNVHLGWGSISGQAYPSWICIYVENGENPAKWGAYIDEYDNFESDGGYTANNVLNKTQYPVLSDTDTIDYYYNGHLEGQTAESGIIGTTITLFNIPTYFELPSNSTDSVVIDGGTHDVDVKPINVSDSINYVNEDGTTVQSSNIQGIYGQRVGSLNIPSDYHLANDGTQNFTFNGNTHNVNIRPNIVTDTINYQYNGIPEGSTTSGGNDYGAQDASDRSFTFNAGSKPNGINNHYHIASDNTVNYDGDTHTVQVSPDTVNETINFQYGGSNEGSYTTSGLYSSSQSVAPTNLHAGWHIDGNPSFTFNSDGGYQTNVNVSPNTDNDTINYVYNGPNGVGNVNTTQNFSGNDYQTGVNGGFTVGVNPTGLPANYHVVNPGQYINYDNGTHTVNVAPNFQVDQIIYHDVFGSTDNVGDPSWANKYVSDVGYYTSNYGHPIYSVSGNDVPNGFALVDGNGNVVNYNQDNFAMNDSTHTLNVAPVYDGLTYDYNKNNNSVTFVSGTLNWNGTSNSSFVEQAPNQIKNASSISFGPNVNIGGLNSTHMMFQGDNYLQYLDLGNSFNTGNVNDMSSMFQSDGNLHTINLGPSFNTGNVHNTSSMFQNDGSLNQVNGLNSLNMSNVNNITRMFNNDSAFNSLDLSGWDVSNVHTMSDVFSGDSNLRTLDLSSWTPNGQGQGDNFNGDNALVKLSLNSGFHLNSLGSEFANCNFFTNNVDANGIWSTGAIENGTQSSNVYYAAKPVTVNYVYPGNTAANTGKTIGTPLSADGDYHGNVQNQIAGVGVVTPTGYSRSSNNPYTIQNAGSSNPYVNINLIPETVTVPVQFINNANGHNDVVYSYVTPNVAMGNTVNINTTLPQGYNWNQPVTSQWKVTIGGGPGEISNNGGQTNPLKLYVKGNQVTIPINYINQENDLAATTSLTTHVDSDVTWPTQTGMAGLTIDPGQQLSAHVEGTYTENGDDNYMNNNGNANYVHLDSNRPGYTQIHYMNVSAQATHVLATITIVKQSPNKTDYGTVKVPVEGHVDDSYTVSDSDFNVPKGYTLNTPHDTYTAKLTAPGQYQWNHTNNPWDNANHRPEIVYTADDAGAINIRYVNQNNQEVGNETAVTGKVGAPENLQNSAQVPAGYTYDASRTTDSNVTFANQPQTFTVYVTGNHINSIPVKYSASGLSGNALNDGTVSGNVGDVVSLPTNHVPVGYTVSSDQNLGANHHGGNLNYLIQPTNVTQYVNLKSRQLVLPVQFKDVGLNVNSNNQIVGSVNYATQGTLTSSKDLPSAPAYYQYASGQPTSYQFEPNQISSKNSDQMNMATVNVVGVPTQTRVYYVDPIKHTVTSYVASDYMGATTQLHAAPQGYVLDGNRDIEYTPLPNDAKGMKSGKAQMDDYVVPVHAQHYQNIKKNIVVKYEDSDQATQFKTNKLITMDGYSNDLFTFDPKDLNVPSGYKLVTTDLDQAQINPNGTATWLAGHDPTIAFMADSVRDALHVTQIEELPNHTVVGAHSVSYPVNGDVGQSYSVADDQIPVPNNYHLASNGKLTGQITANGITNNHAVIGYVKNGAKDIDVHYRIHGHDSDISSYDYNKNDYRDAYVGESINGFDHVPQGYCLDTSNTSSDTNFTFSNDSQNEIVYVSPCTPKKNAVDVNVVLEDVNGQPINDPKVPVLSNVKGRVTKGYQVMVPADVGPSEDFTITPGDAHLAPYVKGYVPYQNGDISGIQKADGLDITSPNKNTFVYRASTDPKQTGSIDVKYMNQNGQILNNTTNNQSDYVIPDGYRGRYISDVTKLARVPQGYQLLNTDQKACTFNGTQQTALMIVNGKTFNDKVHVLRVEEDSNDQTSKTVSDYYDLPNARVGNSYMISALDYIPDGYDEDTSNNLDQPTTFTVQPDGTLNNGAAVTFYYRSNADRYLTDLKDITVNYRVHYPDGSSHLVSDDRLMNHGLINPDQVPDVYDGQMVPDVTKYVPVPNGYKLDTTPRQDVEATVSVSNLPKITLNVSPTYSNHHDSDDQTNAQPIFTAFENNDGQVIDEEGNLIGDHGHVAPTKANQELRLDGPMGHKINPLDTYPVPAGYHLADDQIPVYEITNQVQHHIIDVQPNPDSTRNYHLTIKTLTPSDQPLNTVHSDIEIPVKINKTVTVKPSAYNPDPTNYQFDSGASTDGGDLHITNTNLHLNENSGTLVYKVQPNSDVGTITVSYFDGPQFINRGVIQGQYAQQKYTVSDIANNVAPSQGFQVNTNQKHTYVIGDSGNQNVNIYVHGHANKPSDRSDVAVVTLVKEDNTGKKIASDNVNYAINKSVGDDYTINPNEFLPKGFKLDKSHAGSDKPVNGMVQADGLSKAGVTFYYQSTQSPAPIYLKYINQAGNQVGNVAKLTGGYGHTISDITKQSDGGVNLPKGYQLTASLNQSTKYTFGNDSQHVDLFITGQPTTNHYSIQVTDQNGDNPQSTQTINKTYQGRVGDQITVNPDDYLLTGYQLTNQDREQVITATPNSQTDPATINFTYNERPVTGHVIYKDDRTNEIVGQQPVVGVNGSQMAPQYSDYETYLPYGYEYDYLDGQNGSKLTQNGQYFIYLKKLPVKAQTAPTQNQLGYVNVEYRDTTNGQIVNTVKVAGNLGHSFSANDYAADVPNGYKAGQLDRQSARPTHFEKGVEPTVIVDMAENGPQINSDVTDTIRYVDSDGHVVNSRQVTGLKGASIDWSQYAAYVPKGYVYNHMGNYEMNLTDKTNVIYVQPDTPEVQYGTVNINYVDASDGKPVMTNQIYGLAGSLFNLSKYEDNLPTYSDSDGPHSYQFQSDHGSVMFFNTGAQSITVSVHKAPKPAPMFGTVTVKYVDATTGQKLNDNVTISGRIGDSFNPSIFENNLPESYEFVKVLNPVYAFGVTPHTMEVDVKRLA